MTRRVSEFFEEQTEPLGPEPLEKWPATPKRWWKKWREREHDREEALRQFNETSAARFPAILASWEAEARRRLERLGYDARLWRTLDRTSLPDEGRDARDVLEGCEHVKQAIGDRAADRRLLAHLAVNLGLAVGRAHVRPHETNAGHGRRVQTGRHKGGVNAGIVRGRNTEARVLNAAGAFERAGTTPRHEWASKIARRVDKSVRQVRRILNKKTDTS